MLKWKKGGKEKKLLTPMDSFVILVHRWEKGYLEEEREKNPSCTCLSGLWL